MPRLVKVCPTFEATYHSLHEEWTVDEEFPEYMALAELARHLIALLQAGDTTCFGAVFRAVEEMLISGDKYVVDAMTVGLLEALQNANLHEISSGEHPTQPEDFRSYLLPLSERRWDELYAFWARVGTGSLADAIRFETGLDP